MLFLCGIALRDFNASKMLLWIFNAIGYESELIQNIPSNSALFLNIRSRTYIIEMVCICFMNPSCIPLHVIYIQTGQLPKLLEKFHFKQSFV